MLEIVRKHIGWGLKVILAVTIVTFVFFFGFNQLYRQTQDATAIKVGKQSILFAELRIAYDSQVDRLRKSMKDGEIPDFLLKSLKESAQRQLITQSLIDQFAHSHGFKVIDEELRDNILKDKDFDPVAYKNFIRNFYNRYGLSYEDLIRKELLLNDFQSWVQKVEPIDEEKGEIQWTFETVAFPKEKKGAAFEAQKLWSLGKEANPLLKQNKLAAEKVGPIALDEHKKVFGGQLKREDYAKIFALTRPKSGPLEPFVNQDEFLVVRLLEIKKPGRQKPENKETYLPHFRVTDSFFRAFADKTKVESFIKADDL